MDHTDPVLTLMGLVGMGKWVFNTKQINSYVIGRMLSAMKAKKRMLGEKIQQGRPQRGGDISVET